MAQLWITRTTGLCAIAMLCGCGRSVTRITVANWAGPQEIAIENRNIAAFCRKHPGVQVTLEPIPSNYRQKILSSIAAGTPPDVFLLDSTIIPVFIDHDLVRDLAPYARRYHVDLGQYYLRVLNIARRGRRLYALPKDFTPLVMYYNKDLFDRAGVPYPRAGWSWSEFRALAVRLTRDTNGDGRPDQFGTVTYPDFSYWPPWVWSNRSDFLDPTGRRATGYLNSPGTVQALQFLIDLRKGRPAAAPDANDVESAGGPDAMFAAGRVAMAEGGHWWLPQLRPYLAKGSLHVGVVPLPVPPGGKPATVLYESGWCVAAASKHPDLAAQLAIYLSSVAANRRRMEQGLAIPANVALEREALRHDRLGVERVFYSQIAHARPSWGTRVEKYDRVVDLTQEAFQESLVGGRDLRAALTSAARKIDRELAYPEPRTLSGAVQVRGFVLLALALTVLALAAVYVRARGPDRRRLLTGYAFLAPSLVLLVVFGLGPVLFSLYLAFHRWNIVDPSTPFIGLANFRDLLADRWFWNAVENTAIYTLQVPVGMALALLVAMLLNRPGRWQGALRTVFFLPSVCSFVAIAMVWKWLYNPDYGLFNFVLRALGLPAPGWLTDQRFALLALMLMAIWQALGYEMVIYLAGLQGIPRELYEAATIDGAGGWERFRYVTVPMLRPATFFVLVTSVISSFQVFTSVYVMTKGGPLHATDVIVYHIYQNAWEFLKMGYASAMAWTLFLMILVATWLQFRFVGSEAS